MKHTSTYTPFQKPNLAFQAQMLITSYRCSPLVYGFVVESQFALQVEESFHISTKDVSILTLSLALLAFL